MTVPDPGLDFTARCAALCPGFVAGAPPRRLRRSELLTGTVGGAAVLAKRLAKPDPTAAWYFAREVALYRGFAAEPPGVRVPRLIAADDDVLVIELLAGTPLATRRRPGAALPIRTIAALLASLDELAAWTHAPPAPAPPAAARGQLRDRLLENPSEPSWIRDGVRLAARRGLLPEPLGRTADDALGRYPATAFGHGDLLLRNAIADDDDSLALVDWKSAGTHPRDWDRAVLWTQLAGPARGIVEDAVRDSAGRWRAFLGLVAFAFARELRVFETAGPGPERAALHAELAAIAGRLAAA